MLEDLRGYAGVVLVCSVSEISRVLDWALSCERGLEGSTALEKINGQGSELRVL